MARVHLPAPLRAPGDKEGVATVAGGTVAEALANRAAQRPDIAKAVWADPRRLAPGVAVFLGRANVRSLKGLDTPIGDDADLFLVVSLLIGR